MNSIKVKFLESLHVEQNSTTYLKGAEVEVPQYIVDRHGPEGTGLLELLPENTILPPVEIIDETIKVPIKKKAK
jgi:hypothetical protein